MKYIDETINKNFNVGIFRMEEIGRIDNTVCKIYKLGIENIDTGTRKGYASKENIFIEDFMLEDIGINIIKNIESVNE